MKQKERVTVSAFDALAIVSTDDGANLIMCLGDMIIDRANHFRFEQGMPLLDMKARRPLHYMNGRPC